MRPRDAPPAYSSRLTPGVARTKLAVLALLALGLAPASPPSAQGHFLRGVTALHNFAYEDAVVEFREAQRIDPGFAMPYWGEAMAGNQTLWLNQDRAAARRALERLGPTPEARAARAGSDKDQALLAAVEVLFGDGDKATRDRAYAEAMGRLHARHPDDDDVAAFYALALMATALRSPALYSEANEDAHQHALVGSAIQARAANILEGVLKRSPRHPGALHYLIHDYDDPDHARLALPAARAYAKVAPESSHALHMPAHIFLQLGRWDEAAASDEASFAQSVEWTKRRGLGIGLRDYHSLSWLCFEALQQGRFRKARETLDLIRPAVTETGASRLKAVQSLMRAQYVIETRSWEMLRGQADFSTSAELFAIGMSAAQTGVSTVARQAQDELRRRSRGAKDAAVMEREVAAVVELRAGRGEQALTLAEEAVSLEKELPPPLGPPRPVKPARELHGEILLELHRPAEAAVAFEQALARWPNRSASVLGLARASAAAGDRVAAQKHYRQLLSNWRHADPEVSGLAEATRAVAGAR